MPARNKAEQEFYIKINLQDLSSNIDIVDTSFFIRFFVRFILFPEVKIYDAALKIVVRS